MASRWVIVAAAAVAALALGSLVILGLAEGPEVPVRATTGTGATTGTTGRTEPEAAAARAGSVEARASDPASAWAAVPYVTTPAQLGTLAPALGGALRELRNAIRPCLRAAEADAESQAGDSEPPALVLRLEASDGWMRVDDTEVEAPGQSPSLLACAQERLRGYQFTAAGVEPGRRVRLSFPLR